MLRERASHVNSHVLHSELQVLELRLHPCRREPLFKKCARCAKLIAAHTSQEQPVKIEGTSVAADAFRSRGPTLLTHYHRDHMQGIERLQPGCTVYCSELSARLLEHLDNVPRELIRPVREGEKFEPQEGVQVTALAANHCLGSLMFLVETGGGRTLYTGDFRLNDEIRRECERLAGLDLLYVDSTYDAPHYRFPPQHVAIEQILDIIRRKRSRRVNLAVYTVGKDRILQAVHSEFREPIYMTERKFHACQLMELGHLATRNKDDTRFCAYSRGYLEHYYLMSRASRSPDTLVIVPTGFAVDARPESNFHYVAYSEHCDHAELNEFKQLIKARRTVPI